MSHRCWDRIHHNNFYKKQTHIQPHLTQPNLSQSPVSFVPSKTISNNFSTAGSMIRFFARADSESMSGETFTSRIHGRKFSSMRKSNPNSSNVPLRGRIRLLYARTVSSMEKRVWTIVTLFQRACWDLSRCWITLLNERMRWFLSIFDVLLDEVRKDWWGITLLGFVKNGSLSFVPLFDDDDVDDDSICTDGLVRCTLRLLVFKSYLWFGYVRISKDISENTKYLRRSTNTRVRIRKHVHFNLRIRFGV